jgi:Tfp pilus assembly protein PilV
VKDASQRGSTLLEALVATALTAALILSASAAVLGVLHATASGAERTALTEHALNVLSDLREATAYDGKALVRIAGRTATSTFLTSAVPGEATRLSTTVSVVQASASTPPVATVTVADPSGAGVTLRQALFAEAPAPGSVVDQSSPTPAAVIP